MTKIITSTRTLRVVTVDLPGGRGVELSLSDDALVISIGFQANGGRIRPDDRIELPGYMLPDLLEGLEALREES